MLGFNQLGLDTSLAYEQTAGHQAHNVIQRLERLERAIDDRRVSDGLLKEVWERAKDLQRRVEASRLDLMDQDDVEQRVMWVLNALQRRGFDIER